MCNKIQCLLSKAKHCILWFLSKGTSLYHRIFSLSTCFFTFLWAYNDRNSAFFQRSAIADYDIVVGGTTLHRLSISNINGDMVNTLIPPIPWCSGSTEANQVSWSEFFGSVCFGGLNLFFGQDIFLPPDSFDRQKRNNHNNFCSYVLPGCIFSFPPAYSHISWPLPPFSC